MHTQILPYLICLKSDFSLEAPQTDLPKGARVFQLDSQTIHNLIEMVAKGGRGVTRETGLMCKDREMSLRA